LGGGRIVIVGSFSLPADHFADQVSDPCSEPTTQIPFVSMPLLGAGGMFGFYLYLAKNTDVRTVAPAFPLWLQHHRQDEKAAWS
jgi:hypothetical protein